MKKDKEWLIDEIRKLPCEVQRGYLKIKAVDILPLIEQLDESEKVVIPKFVADHIELCKSKNKRLNVALSESPEDEMAFEMGVNLEEANEIYARAWLDGYEVEKEKLYVVELINNNLMHCLAYDLVDKVFFISQNQEERLNKFKKRFTEKEIKDYDPRFMAFAEEVTE